MNDLEHLLEAKGAKVATRFVSSSVMFRALIVAFAVLIPAFSSAQFVYPKPEYNVSVPGTYKEDPFIVEYRKKFFAVFKGDLATFEKATKEIDAMLVKNPFDARAMVWKGNGITVRAAVKKAITTKPQYQAMLEESRKVLDKAVSLSPDDPNIYMMRAATLYIQGQFWKLSELPIALWATLRDDCKKFITFIGPKRMSKVSIHVKGEAYGELGIANARLGDKVGAYAAFRKVIELCPRTDYSKRAEKEIVLLGPLHP